MADLKLSASTRTESGHHSKGLRRQGQIPAILYGHNLEPSSLTVDERGLAKIWRDAGRTHFIELKVDDGAARKVLIRDLQIDPRSARALHADFFAVNMREKMTAEVPLVLVGDPPAVSEFKVGQLLQTVTSVKVECLPHDLPAQLTVDVSDLAEIDAHHTFADIPLPEGVTLVHTDLTELVVKIAQLRVQAVEEEEEAAEAAAEAAASEEEAGETPAAEGGEASPQGS
jgi:large subunit ribosomal protein L25